MKKKRTKTGNETSRTNAFEWSNKGRKNQITTQTQQQTKRQQQTHAHITHKTQHTHKRTKFLDSGHSVRHQAVVLGLVRAKHSATHTTTNEWAHEHEIRTKNEQQQQQNDNTKRTTTTRTHTHTRGTAALQAPRWPSPRPQGRPSCSQSIDSEQHQYTQARTPSTWANNVKRISRPRETRSEKIVTERNSIHPRTITAKSGKTRTKFNKRIEREVETNGWKQEWDNETQ